MTSNKFEAYYFVENLNIPNFLYHATYKKLLKSIKLNGLGGIGSEKKKWEDSKKGLVYLAINPDIAYSYAETSENMPEDWLDEIVMLKINTNGLDKSKFNIDKNVMDNTGDTIEYSGIIPINNISIINYEEE